nr:immunoglobulin heavy chain junction region [Macaca mulatta]MOV87243.1 immunoglobulin heavy chain junction region [Macaca mulatta]MOV87343.1 immunoglobulin heavy chain junction region [Macaca mulatta]MOV87357.1 immunoglobulin heavy chain junction region [Macaca mulatta]MOV87429.1 immunoglobulin heavy chain junction region [Macaca mulatta]
CVRDTYGSGFDYW